MTTLLDLVSRRVALSRKGNRHVGRCPLHGPDKHPSFAVWEYRGEEWWGCWACGKGGGIIKWLMTVEGLDYPKAMKVIDGEEWEPDPEVLLARQRMERRKVYRKRVIQAFLNRNPDGVADAFLVALPDERLIMWAGRP